jgi:ribosome-binding factor A
VDDVSDGARARKLADRVHEVVAEALEKRIKDPRLGFVTITDARVTNDLQHATVFYTVFGSPEEQQASAAALESAKGVLRSEVGRRTGIRLTPTLEFILDAVPENAAHIEELLREAREPDPYKKPADDEDETDDEFAGDILDGEGASRGRPAP